MRLLYYYFLNFFNSLAHIGYNDRLRVLAYHKVTSTINFERQINYLKNHYNLISIYQLQDYFLKGEKLPKRPLLVTFDDGDISVLKNGLPILEKYNVPSVIFVITSLIGGHHDYWIKQVEGYEMNVKGNSYAQAREAVNRFKNMSNAERVAIVKRYPAVNKQQLSLADLEKMILANMFVANHTHTHPMLDKCSNDEIVDELKKSTSVFKELDLSGENIFAYPNGNADDRTNKILRDFGMKLIFLFDHRINNKIIDQFNISRIRIDSETPFNEFKVKVSGVHPLIFHRFKS